MAKVKNEIKRKKRSGSEKDEKYEKKKRERRKEDERMLNCFQYDIIFI